MNRCSDLLSSRNFLRMGSEGSSGVIVHVTGFKKFYGVAHNPTETIVSNLEQFMEREGLPKGLVLGSCTVLEAAGQGILAPLNQIFESGRSSGFSKSERVILVSYLSSVVIN